MQTAWEPALAQFLDELTAVQQETLDLLNRKRELLVKADTAGLAALQPKETSVTQRLQHCLEQRERLLAQAAQEGMPATSLGEIARCLPKPQSDALNQPLRSAGNRMRLLQHHSLTNWLLVQRTLLHLARVLEIIATGGRMQPTYGQRDSSVSCGGIIDRAA